jgi:hypothetical protein
MLLSACTFDSSRLRAPPQPGDASGPSTFEAGRDQDLGTGPRDLGDGGPGETRDLATGGDAYRSGDGPAGRDVIDATGADAPGMGPDSAGSPDGAGMGEVGRDRDGPIVDTKDAALEARGSDEGTNPVDAPEDVISSRDVITVGMETGDANDDTRRPVPEAGEQVPDALMDTADAGTMAVDSAADGAPAIDPDLVLWYPFDEASGTTAYDSAQFGGVARNATLATIGVGGSATFTTARQVGTHALALSPAMNGGGYVVVPALNTLAPGAITIALWVNLAAATSNQIWERIYDFGNSSTGPTWFNLVARNGTVPYEPVFFISNTGHPATEQQKLAGSTALTANTWHHIAVVLPAGATYTGVLYVDGAVAASNSTMNVHLSDIGTTANNWLGRSPFSNDPTFYGSLDDFRVYRRALSQQEIVALMALR